MSMLMEVLKEEYDRLERQKIVYEKSLIELPKGYISKKNIRGKDVFYLQHREGQKIVSKYISSADLPEIERQVKQRKQLEDSLKRVAIDMKQISKVLNI